MHNRRLFVAVALLLAVAVAFAPGCSSSPKKKRKRTILATTYDDARVGAEQSKSVAAEMGLYEDPALTAYIAGIGRKLLRGQPRQSFAYQFSVVDMVEPNAFALPGGYIFISRGLLALVNNEDELACVIGHEITHAAHRHAAAQQDLAGQGFPLAMPWARAAKMRGYQREMEHDADKGGQILCAAAGYDPLAMSTFLKNLGQSERLTRGYTHARTIFDTHPGTQERSASTAVRAAELRWERDPDMGEPRQALLRNIDGIAVGQRPAAGVFVGDTFMHPDLDFQLRFPSGWQKSNSAQAVGAAEPRGAAVVFMTADMAPGDMQKSAEAWVAKENENGANLNVLDSKPVKVGSLEAWRMEVEASSFGGGVTAYVTFLPYAGSTWRVTGVSRSIDSGKYLGRTLATTRSFRPLTEEQRKSITSTRLKVVKALKGDDLERLTKRTKNAWSIPETAVYNGMFVNQRFMGGELVKIVLSAPYVSPAP